eukprot:72851-Rhodomonas_salina.1
MPENSVWLQGPSTPAETSQQGPHRAHPPQRRGTMRGGLPPANPAREGVIRPGPIHAELPH